MGFDMPLDDDDPAKRLNWYGNDAAARVISNYVSCRTPSLDFWGEQLRSAFNKGHQIGFGEASEMADGMREGFSERLAGVQNEVKSVLQMLDELAELWGDEGKFRACRDRLRALVTGT